MVKLLLICLGMFTKLPLPIVDWDEGKGPGALCFLPVAGLIASVPIMAVLYICEYFGVSHLVAGAFCLVASYAVCGFVHFDGYMDTADSLLSARDRETKLRILKDSTVGAFSVIAIVTLLIVDFAAFSAIYDSRMNYYVLMFIPALSRAMGDVVLFNFEPLSSSGIMKYFKTGQRRLHNNVAVMWVVLLSAGLWVLTGEIKTLIVSAAVIITGLFIAKHAEKELGGINGDIVGAVIVITEALGYLLLVAVL